VEVYEKTVHDDEPLHALLMRRPPGKPSEPMVNFSIMHGVQASLTYDKTGDLKQALAKSNPEVAPHLVFADLGAHGYSTVRATATTLETDFICIPPPAERSPTDDGGPVLYRARFRANTWQPGQAPALQCEIIEGEAPFSV
jgi:alkaline phosphatase D